jgi:hypothetical protein
MARDVPDDAKVGGPPPLDRHPELAQSSSLLFHLPKSKAAELKRAAMPDDGSWVSTYDACVALVWRTLSKHRAALYKTDLAAPTLWAQAVNMRRRLEPPVPQRLQGNLLAMPVSIYQPTQPTAGEIISELPLSSLAGYVRRATDGSTQESFMKALAAVAPVRDKTTLFMRVNAFPPLTVAVTDWRETAISEADFGFAKPGAYRHLHNTVTEGLVTVYPPRFTGNPDEGCEFVIACEKSLVRQLAEDPGFSKYFEFRGVDAEESDNMDGISE